MLLTTLTGWRIRLFGEERAATAVEYALMLALIAIVIVAAVTALGTSTSGAYANPDLNGALSS